MPANRKRSPGTQRYTLVWLALIGAFLLELFAYAWCRVESTRVGYAIETELRLRERQTAARKNLTIELAHLKSPDRIERLGRGLGLAAPRTDQIRVVP